MVVALGGLVVVRLHCGVLTKIFSFPYLSIKLNLTLPTREKGFGVHILGPSLNRQIF